MQQRTVEVSEDELYEAFNDTEQFACRFLLDRGKPIVPYKFQIAYWKAFGKTRYVRKARQLGFSFASALEALRVCMTTPNQTIVLISLTFPQAVNFLSKAKKLYHSFPDIIRVRMNNGSVLDLPKIKCEILTEQMRFLHDEGTSMIVSLPNNPKAARGYTADVAYWDETANFDHESEMKSALEPTTTRGGLVNYISTDHGTGTMFYKESMQAKEGELEDTAYFEVPYTEVPIPGSPDFIQERDGPYHKKVAQLIKKWGYESFFIKEEYRCIAVDESVAMFPHEILKAAQDLWTKHGCFLRVPVGDRKVYAGIDVGRSKDLTVVYFIEDCGDYCQVVGIETMFNVPFEEQKIRILDTLQRYHATWVHVDETGAGRDLAEWLVSRYGVQVEPVHFNPTSKEMLIIGTYVQMHARKVAIPTGEVPNGEELYNQLHNVVRERSEKSGVLRYVQQEGSAPDDHLWAFCLAAAYLTNPNLVGGAYSIGDKESSMFTQEPKGFKLEKYAHEPLQRAFGGGTKEGEAELSDSDKARLENAKKLEEERKWAFSLWKAPKKLKHENCSGCPSSCTLSHDHKEGAWIHQSKDANSDQYVCDRCQANMVRVRKK